MYGQITLEHFIGKCFNLDVWLSRKRIIFFFNPQLIFGWTWRDSQLERNNPMLNAKYFLLKNSLKKIIVKKIRVRIPQPCYTHTHIIIHTKKCWCVFLYETRLSTYSGLLFTVDHIYIDHQLDGFIVN